MAEQKKPVPANQPSDPGKLDVLPGITGPKVQETDGAANSGNTGGLWNDAGDGTIGEVGKKIIDETDRDRDAARANPSRNAPTSSTTGDIDASDTLEQDANNTDVAGQLPYGMGATGATRVGGMGTGTGRGRGSDIAGGVAGGGSSSGTGGVGETGGSLGDDISGGLTGGTGGQGVPERGSQTSTSGGVAVNAGRGGDLGTVGGGMAPDEDPSVSSGMSGGSMGGSSEADLGGGLSGGMRSGRGTDVSGATGNSDDETENGDAQRPRRS